MVRIAAGPGVRLEAALLKVRATRRKAMGAATKKGDRARAAQRGPLELAEGRPVLGRTQAQRAKLLAAFGDWLKSETFSLGEILFVTTPDIEMINLQLEKYGRCLFRAGRPYGN